MKVTRTQREGEHLLEDMVELVRTTYPETMATGDGRGLARLEQAWFEHRLPRRSTGGMRFLVATMAMAALVVGGTAVFQQFDKLTYEVMNGSIGPGGFVRPTAAGTTIVFSEGSEIALGDAARTRVDALTADGGRVVVESGSVHARIVHRKKAAWVVEAGPYTIQVTGTAFKVKWSWTSELLDLQMHHGSVIVTGPLAPSGVTLTTGMRLTANPRAGLAIAGGSSATAAAGRQRAGTAGNDSPREGSPAPDPAEDGLSRSADFNQASDALGAVGGTVRPNGALRPRGASVSARQSADRRVGGGSAVATAEAWDRQLARGNVQGILDDADARGIDRVLETASGRELAALADAARYGHRPSLARRTLLSLRDRFPRSSQAREAAFFLGGLSEDAAGSTGGQATALDWYDRYLDDHTRGRYAAQALGRKMVITQRLKGAEAARAVAGQYLERFPAGPYASAARKLMRAP